MSPKKIFATMNAQQNGGRSNDGLQFKTYLIGLIIQERYGIVTDKPEAEFQVDIETNSDL